MGVRLPLPAPSILFIFIGLLWPVLAVSGHLGYKFRYSAHPVYFNRLRISDHLLFQ
jgi:hypothetical protein